MQIILMCTCDSYMMQVKILTYSIVMKYQSTNKERWIKVVKDELAEKADIRKVDRRQLPHDARVSFWDCPNLLVDDLRITLS